IAGSTSTWDRCTTMPLASLASPSSLPSLSPPPALPPSGTLASASGGTMMVWSRIAMTSLPSRRTSISYISAYPSTGRRGSHARRSAITPGHSISPRSPNSCHRRAYAFSNSGWDADVMRSIASDDHGVSSTPRSPGARSDACGSNGPRDMLASVSVFGEAVKADKVAARKSLCSKPPMEAGHPEKLRGIDDARLAELRRTDAAHLLHPFTDHNDLHRGGTHVIQAASGCHIVDETGQRLLDGLAGLWCVNAGYGRREIADAVHRQILDLSFYPSFFNSTTEPTILLAEKLAEHLPNGLGRVFFSNSGSEANESALKLVRAYNKTLGRPHKTKILTRTFSYHGVCIATTSMTGLASCQDPFDLPLPGFLQVPGPHAYGVQSPLSAADYAAQCIAETEKTILAEGADTIAALFAEPIQGAGGVIVPPPGHLRELRELCRKHDILFVADEVI